MSEQLECISKITGDVTQKLRIFYERK